MTIANHDVFMSDGLSDLISYESNDDKKLGQFEVMIEFQGQKMLFDIFEFENPLTTGNDISKKILGIVVPHKLMYTISSMYNFDHKLEFDIGSDPQKSLYKKNYSYKISRILKAKKNLNATWNVIIEFGVLYER